MLVVPLLEPDPGSSLQGVAGVEGAAEDTVGGGAEGDWEVEGSVEDQRSPRRGRCSQAVLDFLSTTDVGRRMPAEEDTVSEVSEAELREWEEIQRAEAEKEGAGEEPLFPPTPSFMASADEEQGAGHDFPLSFFL